MRSNLVNFALDAVLLATMLVLISTGALLKFVLPPGSRGGAGLSLWGWSRHEWGDLHFFAATVLVSLICLHLILHWQWVCAMLLRWLHPGASPVPNLRRKLVIGAVATVIILGLITSFLLLAASSLTRGTDQDGGLHRRYRGGRAACVDPPQALSTQWSCHGVVLTRTAAKNPA
jgi:hypothetical protein